MGELGSSGLPTGAVPVLHDVARYVARWMYRPAYRIRIHGAELIPRTGPVLLVTNHSSLIEPQVIFGVLPRRSVFLVKAELSRGLLGRAIGWLGLLPVQRGAADRAPLRTAVAYLRSGGLVGVFPEGTRGAGDVRHAEPGAAWLVRASGAMVLPVATRGTLRPSGARRRFRPKLDVLVGAPFRLSVQGGRAGLVDGTEQIRGRLAGLVRELDDLRAAEHEQTDK